MGFGGFPNFRVPYPDPAKQNSKAAHWRAHSQAPANQPKVSWAPRKRRGAHTFGRTRKFRGELRNRKLKAHESAAWIKRRSIYMYILKKRKTKATYMLTEILDVSWSEYKLDSSSLHRVAQALWLTGVLWLRECEVDFSNATLLSACWFVFCHCEHPVPLPTYREEAADRLWIRTIQQGASPPSHTSSAAHVSTVEMLRMWNSLQTLGRAVCILCTYDYVCMHIICMFLHVWISPPIPQFLLVTSMLAHPIFPMAKWGHTLESSILRHQLNPDWFTISAHKLTQKVNPPWKRTRCTRTNIWCLVKYNQSI